MVFEVYEYLPEYDLFTWKVYKGKAALKGSGEALSLAEARQEVAEFREEKML